MWCSTDHCSLSAGKSPVKDLKGVSTGLCRLSFFLVDCLNKLSTALRVFQEEEAVQEEELQEEEQEVETWTGNVKACTCDCESAESPTLNPAAAAAAAAQPVLLTSPSPPPPKAHLLHCMPGELACHRPSLKPLMQPSIPRLQLVWLQLADGSILDCSPPHLGLYLWSHYYDFFCN